MRFFHHFLLLLLTALTPMTAQVSESEITISPLLKGTLFSPQEHTGKLVILIAGSGPTNRSGNQVGLHNNSLRFLAQSLSDSGFAVFSYDKRLFAQMAAGNVDENAMRFDDAIADALTVAQHFRTDGKFKKIIFAGHSEGSLIGMVAAKGNADGFISIAGAGRSIDGILHDQISKAMPAKSADTRKFLDLLKQGKTFELDDSALSKVFRESVQPYLISWIKYDPAKMISELKVPVLIINGTKDLQVPEQEAHLLKQAHPSATLAIIPDMNHVLKEIKGPESENHASYNNPALPVAAGMVSAIVNFLRTI